MNQENIGEFIRELRIEKGLTQTELAKLIGVTDKSVSKWENGRCMMDLSLLVPISEIFDISIEELLLGKRLNTNEEKRKGKEAIVVNLKRFKKIANILAGIILCCLLGLGIYGCIYYYGITHYKVLPKESIIDIYKKKNKLYVHVDRCVDGDKHYLIDGENVYINLRASRWECYDEIYTNNGNVYFEIDLSNNKTDNLYVYYVENYENLSYKYLLYEEKDGKVQNINK